MAAGGCAQRQQPFGVGHCRKHGRSLFGPGLKLARGFVRAVLVHPRYVSILWYTKQHDLLSISKDMPDPLIAWFAFLAGDPEDGH